MKKNNVLCPAILAVSMISGKWKPFILVNIYKSNNGLRFSEVQRSLPQLVSRRVLANQLEELVDCGILNRTEFPEVPPRVVYSITNLGEKIIPSLQELAKFGYFYMKTESSKVMKCFEVDSLEKELELFKEYDQES